MGHRNLDLDLGTWRPRSGLGPKVGPELWTRDLGHRDLNLVVDLEHETWFIDIEIYTDLRTLRPELLLVHRPGPGALETCTWTLTWGWTWGIETWTPYWLELWIPYITYLNWVHTYFFAGIWCYNSFWSCLYETRKTNNFCNFKMERKIQTYSWFAWKSCLSYSNKSLVRSTSCKIPIRQEV